MWNTFWIDRMLKERGETTLSMHLLKDLETGPYHWSRSSTISFKTIFILSVRAFKLLSVWSNNLQVQFARATALASYKAKTMEGIAAV